MITALTRIRGKCDKPGFDLPYFGYDTSVYLRVGSGSFILKLTYFIYKNNDNINLLKPNDIYRVSQEEWTKFRESVPYVKVYRYNPKHLYPKLNCYGDNGQRSLKF